MRVEAAVTSVSCLRGEAAPGMQLAFDVEGFHDDEPPGSIGPGDLERLRAADALRLGNVLRAWIEVERGRIVDHGVDGVGAIGTTSWQNPASTTVVPVALPDHRPAPEVGETAARFERTAGGRVGETLLRTVAHAPFVQLSAPVAWTTLALTLHADGSVEHELIAAGGVLRHYIYGPDGARIDGRHPDGSGTRHHARVELTPWGAVDSPELAAACRVALERRLVTSVDSGFVIRQLDVGDEVDSEDDGSGQDVVVLLDGVLAVEDRDDVVAELAAGVATAYPLVLDGGRRTATLRARTPVAAATFGRGAS